MIFNFKIETEQQTQVWVWSYHEISGAPYLMFGDTIFHFRNWEFT